MEEEEYNPYNPRWVYEPSNGIAHYSTDPDEFVCSSTYSPSTWREGLQTIPNLEVYQLAGGRICQRCAKRMRVSPLSAQTIERYERIVRGANERAPEVLRSRITETLLLTLKLLRMERIY